jgi:hypothetical protein
MTSVAAVGALSVTAAFGWQSPTKHRYLTKPLEICDQGTFYVGGFPKITPFANGPSLTGQRQIILGKMYVQFQIPKKSTSWPLIMVHGSGYSGSAVQGTAGGNEGWSDYTVRNGIPTYVVDQPGRGRSGFDHSPINEAVYKINNGDIAGGLALLPGGGTIPAISFGPEGTTAWSYWWGHFVPGPSSGATPDVTASKMIRHGAPGDPECATNPAHCTFLGRLPMEPEAPWAVDQAIKSRTGNGAPAGYGTITPDNAQVMENASYLALDAYKFDLPDSENLLPRGNCPTCNPTTTNAPNTWSPRALAELVEGLGGAIVATHSQSGSQGHHMVRILKEHGKLDLLKGLISFEAVSCSLEAAGVTPADFKNIPYLVLGSAQGGVNAGCMASANAIKAAGGNAEIIDLNEAGWWQGNYVGPFGDQYVGPFAGTTHMMMIEDNPGPGGKATNLQTMDVILAWADKNISKPAPQSCVEDKADDDDHVPPGLEKKPGGLPPGQAKKKG